MILEGGANNLEVGAIVEGKVTGVKKFGAFVELAPNKTGLVHISEVSDDFVRDITEHIKEGQTIKVKILNITDSGKMELSVKQANENCKPNERRRNESKGYGQKVAATNKPSSFEDMMAKFKKLSDEKLSDMGAMAENKRRRSYHKSNS